MYDNYLQIGKLFTDTNSLSFLSFEKQTHPAAKGELERLQWSRGNVLAFSTQVRGFKPGRSRRIFKGEKILSTPSFGGEVKPSVPCRRFAACKRSLNVAMDSRPRSSTFRC
jgi:hypothetical protein